MSAATFWDTGPGGGRIILKRKPTRADLVMYARKAAPCTICRKVMIDLEILVLI